MVEPTFTEVRQALGRAFSLTCRLLQAHPARLLRYEWKLGSRLLTVGQFSHQRDDTTYMVKALNREGYGEYTCDITNEVGAGRCTFLVTGELAGAGHDGTSMCVSEDQLIRTGFNPPVFAPALRAALVSSASGSQQLC